MKRLNPQTRQWERKEGDAWVPVEAAEASSLDEALSAAFEQMVAPVQSEPAQKAQVDAAAQTAAVATQSRPARARRPVPADAANGAAGGTGVAANGTNGVDYDVPGLVTGDGQKGTSAQKNVRDRLRGLRKAPKPAQQVQVAQRAARAQGPAVRDTTERRQTRTRVVAQDGTKHQRYANKPAPEMLGSRPKWMQELFEAHFRSDMTLQLRRQYNRMKLSRQDYAIGWLTLLDKVREDPSILRLKDGRGSGADNS